MILIKEHIFLLFLFTKLLLNNSKDDKTANFVLLQIARPLTNDKDILIPLKLPGPTEEKRISNEAKSIFNSSIICTNLVNIGPARSLINGILVL